MSDDQKMQWWTTDDLCPNILQRQRGRTRPLVSIVSPQGDIEHLSVQDVLDASDRAAWFLTHHMQEDEERFLYMGPNDVRYFIWILGAMKAAKCVCSFSGFTRDRKS